MHRHHSIADQQFTDALLNPVSHTLRDAVASPYELDFETTVVVTSGLTTVSQHRELPALKSFVIPAGGSTYAVVKRTLDVVGGVVGLIVLSPVIAVVAAITKLIDGGPAVYPHTRVGLHGREFTCYKFRTMVPNADQMKDDLVDSNVHDDHRTFKLPNDPRVTCFGRWLRRSSIDEVLQLWNVVKGEMSLVGPRPPIPEEVAQYSPSDMCRIQVKPGLTGLWQVSGRSRLPFQVQLKLDLQYIEQRSIWLDLKLILLTIPAVLSAKGAY